MKAYYDPRDVQRQEQGYNYNNNPVANSPTMQKKYYDAYESFKQDRYNVSRNINASNPALQNVEYPRSLNTQDIPGALPESFYNKSAKNQELAHRIRENNTNMISGPKIQDSLDRFQTELVHKEADSPYKLNADRSDKYLPKQEAQSPISPSYNSINNQGGDRLQGKDELLDSNFFPTGFDNHRKNPNFKKEHLNELTTQIAIEQRLLEKKLGETIRARPYNIIANSSGYNGPYFQGASYGNTIKNLLRNQEDIKRQDMNRSQAMEPGLQSYSPQRNGNNTSPHGGRSPQMTNKAGYVNDSAGKYNFYGETAYRYANKLPEQQPLQDNQFFGSKALKNLSCVKLY